MLGQQSIFVETFISISIFSECTQKEEKKIKQLQVFWFLVKILTITNQFYRFIIKVSQATQFDFAYGD